MHGLQAIVIQTTNNNTFFGQRQQNFSDWG